MSAVLELASRITPDEYLAGERASETRHEYLDGQVYAMAVEIPLARIYERTALLQSS